MSENIGRGSGANNNADKSSWSISLSDSMSFITTSSTTSSTSTTPMPSSTSLDSIGSDSVSRMFPNNNNNNQTNANFQINNSQNQNNELSSSVRDAEENDEDNQINNTRIRHLIVKYEPIIVPLEQLTQSAAAPLATVSTKTLNLEIDLKSKSYESMSSPEPVQLKKSASGFRMNSMTGGSISSCSNCSRSSSNRFEISSHESMVFSQIISPNPDLNTTRSHENFEIPQTSFHIFKHQGFLIQKDIGHGSYGKVYHAIGQNLPQNSNHNTKSEMAQTVSVSEKTQKLPGYNPEIGKDYAIKLMDMGRLSRTYKRKFLGREIIALLTIPPHDNIIRIYDLFKSTAVPVTSSGTSEEQQLLKPDKIINIIMEFCPNGDMFEYLTKRHHIPEPYAQKWFAQILFAVGHIHDYGFAHRDLKLENLLFDSYFNLKVTDFGFCLKLKDSTDSNSCLTCTKCGNKCGLNRSPPTIIDNGTKVVEENATKVKVTANTDEINRSKTKKFFEEKTYTACGSQLYSSPDLLNGYPYQGTMNDVWSCGVILFVMLYGTYPFTLNDDLKPNERGQYEVAIPTEPAVSAECLQMFDHVFVEENRRSTIAQLQQLPWIKQLLDSAENYTIATNMANVVDNLDDLNEHFNQLNIPRQETLSFEVNDSKSSQSSVCCNSEHQND